MRAHEVQLLSFANASQKGYAAIVFLHIVDDQQLVHINFFTCKTKVALLKSLQSDSSLTIPRLELCVALLLARLLSHQLLVLQDRVKIDQVKAWTDSSIV